MYPFKNKDLPVSERVSDLVSRLTLSEKIHMLSTHQQGVPRLGVGEWYIGTECARGYVTHDCDKPSTVFPQPIGMASMFDDELMEKIGETAGDEFRAYYNLDKKGGLMVWGPTVDPERDPRWGRTEEAYGEDPFLIGKMSAAYTRGLRGNGPVMKTIPTLKHFCANNNEKDRGHCSANVEPRTLHEYYYAAFKPAITEGGAYSVMAAYNELSGVPAICNPDLKRVLKGKWGLGFVVSDGGDFSQNVTYHKFCESHAESLALCLKAGCDVMTDSCELTEKAAYEALKRGLLTEDDIDTAVGNSLKGRFLLGEFDGGTVFDDIGTDIVNNEKAKSLNLLAAKEGITLLKNDGILPLDKNENEKILLCGDNADNNLRDWYTGYSSYNISVFDGLKKTFGEDNILFDNGYDKVAVKNKATGKYLTVNDDGTLSCTAEKISEREIFEYRDLDFDVVNIFSANEGKYIDFKEKAVLGGKEVFQWFTTETVHRRDFEGYAVFESRTHEKILTDENGSLICRKKIGICDEMLFEIEILSKGEDRIKELSKKCKTVICAVGNHPLQVAREMYDRPDITLPSHQESIVKTAFENNPRTIMLIVSSYPYAVNYAEENLPAIVYTCHAGPELGSAVSAVLSGEYNPAGRTPMTWYSSVRELPDIKDYDIIANDMTYQYYRGKPLYPFGYGLSYSEFEYCDFKVYEADSDSLCAELTVKNVSEKDGDEVVQIYFCTESKRKIKRPLKKLCGFKRVNIPAGQSVFVKIPIKKNELMFYDVSREKFCLEAGAYTFMAGASCEDIREKTTLDTDGENIPPRDVRKYVSAVNYDDKKDVKMLWSKKLERHYIMSAWYSSYLFWNNCNIGKADNVTVKVSAYEKPEKIRVFENSVGNAPAAEIEIPPTDGADDFVTISVPVKLSSENAGLILELTGSAALLEFKIT